MSYLHRTQHRLEAFPAVPTPGRDTALWRTIGRPAGVGHGQEFPSRLGGGRRPPQAATASAARAAASFASAISTRRASSARVRLSAAISSSAREVLEQIGR
ncbi:MAG TPA: hypothetical protein VHI98_20005 [Vicinamibacterales bacterium]|nr:hypothetical protein [Vicinamibacterales bacterium]HEX2462339.1 hypothetical protein [Vicinamibacterales bacterium]